MKVKLSTKDIVLYNLLLIKNVSTNKEDRSSYRTLLSIILHVMFPLIEYRLEIFRKVRVEE